MYDYVSSLPAYHEKGKEHCRAIVFTAIKKIGPCNDRQIAAYLNWPINRVTPRRGELVDMGFIMQEKKEKDEVTNRTVSYWIEKKICVQQKLF
jgi:predicted transcriptional regulator